MLSKLLNTASISPRICLSLSVIPLHSIVGERLKSDVGEVCWDVGTDTGDMITSSDGVVAEVIVPPSASTVRMSVSDMSSVILSDREKVSSKMDAGSDGDDDGVQNAGGIMWRDRRAQGGIVSGSVERAACG